MPDLQNILPQTEWIALAWLVLAVFFGTETIKRGIRLFASEYNPGWIYFASLAVSCAAAIALWPGTSTVPWWIPAMIVGPACSWVHPHTLDLIALRWPRVAAVLKGKRKEQTA
ncbi:MAG: hypothetical protein OEZ10_11540 [Gammaproteobacteria bacterium]|nr:hypothetical protein [Gammaproteobacteria bacterium]